MNLVLWILILAMLPMAAFGTPTPSMPSRETREALLKAHIDSLPLSESTIYWLSKRFDGTVQELVLSEAHFWRLSLIRVPVIRRELEHYLLSNGLRLGMTNPEVRSYARDGKFPSVTDQSNIGAIDLSLKTLHPLLRAKIITVGDLRTKSAQELLGLRGFGPTNLIEVERFLTTVRNREADCEYKITSRGS